MSTSVANAPPNCTNMLESQNFDSSSDEEMPGVTLETEYLTKPQSASRIASADRNESNDPEASRDVILPAMNPRKFTFEISHIARSALSVPPLPQPPTAPIFTRTYDLASLGTCRLFLSIFLCDHTLIFEISITAACVGTSCSKAVPKWCCLCK